VVYKPIASQRPRNKRDNSRCFATAWETRLYSNRDTVGNGVMQPIARQLQQLDYDDRNGGVFYVVRAKELSWRQMGWLSYKYMAMGPSGARCQEWPCWLVAGSKLLLCSDSISCQLTVSYQLKVRLWREESEVDVKWPLAWELSVVRWDKSSAREAVKMKPDRIKLRNLHC
jgi:hypothetical protein